MPDNLIQDKYVVDHQVHDLPTYVRPESTVDTVHSVILGWGIPLQRRLELASDIAFILSNGLIVAFSLSVERIYGDYEQGGGQATPSFVERFLFRDPEERKAAIDAMKPFLTEAESLIGDDIVIWHSDDELPDVVLAPSAEVLSGESAIFKPEWFQAMIEGGGDNFNETKAFALGEIPGYDYKAANSQGWDIFDITDREKRVQRCDNLDDLIALGYTGTDILPSDDEAIRLARLAGVSCDDEGNLIW